MLDFLLKPEGEAKPASAMLMEAAQKGDVQKAEALIVKHGAQLKAKDEKGLTPLHHACWVGDVTMVKLILKHGGAELMKLKSKYGSTPLHAAADKGQTSAVRFLLESGAQVDDKNFGGLTPLHYTAWNGHMDTGRVLLDNGADKNARNDEGCTPLHLASQYGRNSMAVMLLDEGADPLAANTRMKTPIDVAKNARTRALLKVKVIDLDKRTSSSGELKHMMNSLIHENNKLLTDHKAHMDNEKKIQELRDELIEWKTKEPLRIKEHEELKAKYLKHKEVDDAMDASIEALQNRMNDLKRFEKQRKHQIKDMEYKLEHKDDPMPKPEQGFLSMLCA